MASTDAKPVPQKNVAFRVTFPLLDADGDLVTGASSLDSEVSKDGGTFADCTNEATEIATSSGMYYLDLTSTEMNADTVSIIVKSASAKTTTLVMYPEEAGDIRVNVTAFGGTAGTFASGRPEVNATHWGGTAVASANVLIDNAITAAKIASNAITDAKIASAALTAAKFASGAFDAVWSVTARLLTAGTNIVLAKGTGVTGFNDLSAAQVNAEADTALADYDGPTNAELTTALGTLNNISTSDVESVVWDVPMANHLGAGTTGDAIFQAAIAAMAVQAVTDNLPDSGALTSIAQASDLAAVQTTADNIETDTQDIQSTLAALSIPSANDNADALLDRADAIETGLTPRGALRLNTAALAGKVSGAGTGTETFRNAVADSKARITSTVDANGNRTAVSADAT
jgi:hypothetical protein